MCVNIYLGKNGKVKQIIKYETKCKHTSNTCWNRLFNSFFVFSQNMKHLFGWYKGFLTPWHLKKNKKSTEYRHWIGSTNQNK